MDQNLNGKDSSPAQWMALEYVKEGTNLGLLTVFF